MTAPWIYRYIACPSGALEAWLNARCDTDPETGERIHIPGLERWGPQIPMQEGEPDEETGRPKYEPIPGDTEVLWLVGGHPGDESILLEIPAEWQVYDRKSALPTKWTIAGTLNITGMPE